MSDDGTPGRSADQLQAAEAVAGGAGGDFADFELDESPLAVAQRLLHGHPMASPTIVLLLAVLYFTVFTDRFMTATNLSTILSQVMIIGTLGLAQTLVILTAGIDLSVGSMAVLSSTVMGKLAIGWGYDPWVALLLGLVTGLVLGAINGLLVTRLNLPPFIATLGTFNVYFALNQWFSENVTISNTDVDAEASNLLWFGNIVEPFDGFRITYGVVFMLVLYGVFWYALRRTMWGRHVYATGDDPEVARLTGIRVKRVLLSVYAVGGVLCALAGWMLIGRIGAVSPKPLVNANLDSITAVVVGGTSLFGGRGAVIGTLIGALIVGVFDSGLSQLGLDPLWRVFAIGVLVLVAVSLDQWIRRVGS